LIRSKTATSCTMGKLLLGISGSNSTFAVHTRKKQIMRLCFTGSAHRRCSSPSFVPQIKNPSWLLGKVMHPMFPQCN
jgi:hypothetical protein